MWTSVSWPLNARTLNRACIVPPRLRLAKGKHLNCSIYGGTGSVYTRTNNSTARTSTHRALKFPQTQWHSFTASRWVVSRALLDWRYAHSKIIDGFFSIFYQRLRSNKHIPKTPDMIVTLHFLFRVECITSNTVNLSVFYLRERDNIGIRVFKTSKSLNSKNHGCVGCVSKLTARLNWKSTVYIFQTDDEFSKKGYIE